MFWYVAKPNEIFLDLDSRKSMTRAFRVMNVWMKAERSRSGFPWNLPPIVSVHHYPTGRVNHCHAVVTVAAEMTAQERQILALWMGSDRLRSAYVFERMQHGLGLWSDLLCTPIEYHRPADFTCQCKGKHKDRKVTDGCHALKMILGRYRSADFFPRVGHKPIKPVQIPVGQVPLSIIRRWKNGKNVR